MNTILDGIAYLVVGAIASLVIVAGVMLTLDVINAIRKQGFVKLWRENWPWIAVSMAMAGLIAFTQWRLER